MRDGSNDGFIDRRVQKACYLAEQSHAMRPDTLAEPHSLTASIYLELCRLDSHCRRAGLPSDRHLPPCQASEVFRARRRCSFFTPSG